MDKENYKSRSGAIFVDKRDMERWQELESIILTNDKEFRTFNESQWDYLNLRIAPLLNKARKNI